MHINSNDSAIFKKISYAEGFLFVYGSFSKENEFKDIDPQKYTKVNIFFPLLNENVLFLLLEGSKKNFVLISYFPFNFQKYQLLNRAGEFLNSQVSVVSSEEFNFSPIFEGRACLPLFFFFIKNFPMKSFLCFHEEVFEQSFLLAFEQWEDKDHFFPWDINKLKNKLLSIETLVQNPLFFNEEEIDFIFPLSQEKEFLSFRNALPYTFWEKIYPKLHFLSFKQPLCHRGVCGTCVIVGEKANFKSCKEKTTFFKVNDVWNLVGEE